MGARQLHERQPIRRFLAPPRAETAAFDQPTERPLNDQRSAGNGASPGASPTLFISHGPNGAGQQLSDVTAWNVVKVVAEALADVRMQEGADAEELRALRGVSPHSLRHYLAQAMLDEGADYKDITAILGHSSSVVTEQFYARLGDERTIEIADTFAPRMNLTFDPANPDDDRG